MIYVILIILFALMQALLLGRIHIFGVVSPLLYVYFALLFPRGYSRWMQMVLCFVMGLAVDMFENTPGLASASMTLIAFLQPGVFELFLKKEDKADLRPGINTMGFSKFLTYVFMLVFLYCIVFFSLEAFTNIDWMEWLISIGGSTLLTVITILIIDSVRR